MFAWLSGGGGVVLLLIILFVKLLPLLLDGVAATAYEEACEDVRWEAYDRYAPYGSRDYVTATVDTFHEDCVAEATDRRTAELDRRHYFAVMDVIFDELRKRNMSGS
jgi:hypothetical protein